MVFFPFHSTLSPSRCSPLLPTSPFIRHRLCGGRKLFSSLHDHLLLMLKGKIYCGRWEKCNKTTQARSKRTVRQYGVLPAGTPQILLLQHFHAGLDTSATCRFPVGWLAFIRARGRGGRLSQSQSVVFHRGRARARSILVIVHR